MVGAISFFATLVVINNTSLNEQIDENTGCWKGSYDL